MQPSAKPELVGPFMFLLIAGWSAPSLANDFEQVWSCELQHGRSLDDARTAASQWLDAARRMDGGRDLDITLRWPIAVPDSDGRFEFVIRSPSLEAWGAFYDNYDPSSPAGRADEEFARVATCSGSTLWEVIHADGASTD